MKGYLFILFSVFSNGIRADFIASVYTQTTVIPEIRSCTKTTYNKLIIQQQALSKIDCGRLCSTDPSCRRIMFDKEKGLCTLFLSGADCITHEGVNGKVCFRQKYVCGNETCTRCPIGYYGGRCEYVIKDCKDGFEKGVVPNKKLVSFIQPSLIGPIWEVKCNFPQSRTYIHYRNQKCLEIDFNKTLNEYSEGFGYALGNYFLGLEPIYNILQNRNFTLVIRFQLLDGQAAQVYYWNFKLDSKSEDYRLSVGSFEDDYDYPCGDAMSNATFNLNGRPFSTFDLDLTNYSCPVRFGSGWWYLDDPVCSLGNVNGRITGDISESTSHWRERTSFSSIIIRLGE